MGFVDQSEPLSRIAAGVIHGATQFDLQGYNAAPTTGYETIWDNSNAYTFLTTNMSSPTLVSASASDTAAGTGARTVAVSGVNSSYAVQTETVTLNGVTPVALTKNYMMINSLTVLTAGSNGFPVGIITLAAAGTTHATIAVSANKSRAAMYCTPAGYGLLVYDIQCTEEAASVGGNRMRFLYSTNLGLLQERCIMGNPNTYALDKTFTVPMYFPEKTQLQVQWLSAAATAVVTCYASCVLINRNNQEFSKWI